MKLLKIVLVFVFLVMVVAQPAWANKPKFDQNPDYIEITEAIDNLMKDAQGASPEESQQGQEAQQQLANLLQYQKYIMETGEDVAECRNETGKALAIYGPKPQKSDSPYDNALYTLASGQTTDEDFNCQGVFLPNGVKVAGLNPTSAVAVKILSGTQLVAKANPETDAIELNIPPAKVFKAGEANWDIPDVSQAAMDMQLPNAPTD